MKQRQTYKFGKWYPTELAPNKQRVLVWCSCFSEAHAAHYHKYETRSGGYWKYDDMGAVRSSVDAMWPTAWMPMPKGPQE